MTRYLIRLHFDSETLPTVEIMRRVTGLAVELQRADPSAHVGFETSTEHGGFHVEVQHELEVEGFVPPKGSGA